MAFDLFAPDIIFILMLSGTKTIFRPVNMPILPAEQRETASDPETAECGFSLVSQSGKPPQILTLCGTVGLCPSPANHQAVRNRPQDNRIISVTHNL